MTNRTITDGETIGNVGDLNDRPLDDAIEYLGWQGGTVHDAKVALLKERARLVSLLEGLEPQELVELQTEIMAIDGLFQRLL